MHTPAIWNCGVQGGAREKSDKSAGLAAYHASAETTYVLGLGIGNLEF
jgi:hypothetical protein